MIFYEQYAYPIFSLWLLANSIKCKFIYLFYLFVLYLKVDKHQIHKTVYIKKIAMYKVTIYTC